jgi:hypothetical protein
MISFSFSSLSKRRGATLVGVFSVALSCALLLCGAGSAPVENFLPQGAMQGDLNAGGHNLTNAGTVYATDVVVSGSLAAPASFTLPFSQLTGTPTSLAGYGVSAVPWSLLTGTPTSLSGYGIADPIVLTSGSYANPAWVTSLAYSKLTGTPGALPPSGSAGGDLSGSYPNPTVTNGAHLGAGTVPNSALVSTPLLPTGSGAGLSALPTNLSLYPTFNQSTTGNAATASAAPLSGITGLGAGVSTALGNAVNGASGPLTLNSSGILPFPLQQNLNPQDVTIVCGESLWQGKPIITEASGQPYNAVGYTGQGKCIAMWLSSLLPGIPVYSYSCGGADSSALARILAGTTGSTNQYFQGATKYGNGAVVGSYSGISALPSSLVPSSGSGGTARFIVGMDGNNDSADSMNVSQYGVNIANAVSTMRGYGSNVRIYCVTSQQVNNRITSIQDGYNSITRHMAYAGAVAPSSFTVTQASPAVLTSSANVFSNNDIVVISGCTVDTALNGTWFVVGASSNTFELSATQGGTAMNNTVGADSGTCTRPYLDGIIDVSPVFTNYNDTNFFASDNTHLANAGCHAYAEIVANTLLGNPNPISLTSLFPAAGQVSINAGVSGLAAGVSTALGYGVDGPGGVATATIDGSIGWLQSGLDSGNFSIAIGRFCGATGGAVSLGYEAESNHSSASVGPSASSGYGGVALGGGTTANNSGVAIGQNATASGQGCAIGYGNNATSGVAMGAQYSTHSSTTETGGGANFCGGSYSGQGLAIDGHELATQAGTFTGQAAQTMVNGSTSGTAVFSEPFAGSSYKKAVIHMAATTGTASYTFPTAFSFTPIVMNADANVTSLSTTAVTVTGAATTDTIILEGY